MQQWFTPNERVPLKWVVVGWSTLALVLWQAFKPTVFPGPLDVVVTLPTLWFDGVGTEVLTSLWTNMEALCLSAIIGLPLAYLSRIPIVSPIASFVGKLRFVGSAVFYLPLLLSISDAHWVKVWLLALGQLFYLVTTMVGIVQLIPEAQFDDARTLRMSEWLSLWYVNLRGTVAEAITAVKDNAATGWAMLMFVEGIIRSEGGVGVVILNAEKHVNYDQFFAVVIVIVLVGFGQDWLLTQARKAVCPYAS